LHTYDLEVVALVGEGLEEHAAVAAVVLALVAEERHHATELGAHQVEHLVMVFEIAAVKLEATGDVGTFIPVGIARRSQMEVLDAGACERLRERSFAEALAARDRRFADVDELLHAMGK
jgi:hypothetical protein